VPVVPTGTAEDLYEHAPCGYLTTLPGGLITRANTTFLNWTGHRREDLVGRLRFQDLLTPGGRIFHETHYAPLLQMQGMVREIAVEVQCTDGTRLPVLVNAILDRDVSGTPLSTRVVVFDATVRRQYERELLAQRRAAERTSARVQVLQRLTAALAAVADAEQIAGVVVRELTPHLGLAGSSLTLADETGQVDGISGITEADGTAARALRERTAAFAGAEAAVPLLVDDRVLGVLRLELPPDGEFTAEDRDLVVTSATQCALAVERALLHAETVENAHRAARLADVSRALDEVRSLAERARCLAAVLVPDLADAAAVDLWTGAELTRVASAPAPAVESAAAESAAAGSIGSAGAVVPAGAVARAMETGEPQLGTSAAASYVVLPLRRAETMGALTLVARDPARRLRERDLPFLTDLAYRAALALENVWVFERERDVAQTLQHAMLAGTPPEDPRFRVATHYRPAVENLEVGGDWYDTFLVGDGLVGIVVGDVVGRGIVAASAMGQLRSAIRALAGTGLGPAALLGHLDRYVDRVDAASMATVVYAEIDLGTGRMRYACAGHPPPLLVDGAGDPAFLWGGRSAPLGTFAGMPPRTEDEITLAPGSRLLLYTDGLVERRTHSILTGLERLAAEMGRRRGGPLPTLVTDLSRALLADEDRRDDVCLLALSYEGPAPTG
jgi:serine/threonine-protein kinase RsbW